MRVLRQYGCTACTALPCVPSTSQAWYPVEQMSAYYAGNSTAVLGNKKQLTNLLKYHIVAGRAIRASQLKDKMTLKMSNGETVMIHVTDK
jgi:hypothetical protein